MTTEPTNRLPLQTDPRSTWLIVRYGKDGRYCGPLSHMTKASVVEGCRYPEGYGFPNRGSIGQLVMFDLEAKAQDAIDGGNFGPPGDHRPRALETMHFRFIAAQGEFLCGNDYRRGWAEGTYEQCVTAAGFAVLSGSGEVRIEDVVDREKEALKGGS